MTITAYKRGHLIEWNGKEWVYADDGSSIKGKERPCIKCERLPTQEGYDACIGYIPGVKSACCGHGVEEGYTILEDTEREDGGFGNG